MGIIFFRTCSVFLGVELYVFSTELQRKPIYVFPEKELRGLSPNFHIHVFVTYLYIHRIGPHIFLQQNKQTENLGNM